ncbi:hypothetical protein K438DRAFT_1791461 [Mycena galopus ATCC 62051]|nr:hypothetical protein K438DRAFT_1791461 [Mycena galopus ATCC 62051]
MLAGVESKLPSSASPRAPALALARPMPPSLTTVAGPSHTSDDPTAHTFGAQRQPPPQTPLRTSVTALASAAPRQVLRSWCAFPHRAGGDIHPAPPILSPALLRMKARARGPQRHHSQTARTRPPSARRTNHLDSITSRSSTSCPLFTTRLCCTTALPHEVTKPRESVRSADLQRLARGKAPHDDTVMNSLTTGALLRCTRWRPIGTEKDLEKTSSPGAATPAGFEACTSPSVNRTVGRTSGGSPPRAHGTLRPLALRSLQGILALVRVSAVHDSRPCTRSEIESKKVTYLPRPPRAHPLPPPSFERLMSCGSLMIETAEARKLYEDREERELQHGEAALRAAIAADIPPQSPEEDIPRQSESWHPPPIPATSPETRIAPSRLGGQPVPSKWAVTFKRDGKSSGQLASRGSRPSRPLPVPPPVPRKNPILTPPSALRTPKSLGSGTMMSGVPDSDERMWPKLPTSKQHKSIAERRNRPALRVQTGGLSKAAHAQQQLHATFARGSTPSSPTVVTFTAREEDTWTPRPPPAPTGASFLIGANWVTDLDLTVRESVVWCTGSCGGVDVLSRVIVTHRTPTPVESSRFTALRTRYTVPARTRVCSQNRGVGARRNAMRMRMRMSEATRRAASQLGT